MKDNDDDLILSVSPQHMAHLIELDVAKTKKIKELESLVAHLDPYEYVGAVRKVIEECHRKTYPQNYYPEEKP